MSGVSGNGNAVREIACYLLDDGEDLNVLKKYPLVREVFLKFNTPLPSSAPVERLFSFPGIINRSRRQKLTDEHFELMVLRKANANKL